MHTRLQLGVSLRLDIGVRFCMPFICRRFASGRQGRRCGFVSLESSLRKPDPEFHIGPLGSIDKPPIEKCGPYAGPERVDPVVSTTVVNLGIFYLVVSYNVEWGEELLIRYRTSYSCFSGERGRSNSCPFARSCSVLEKKKKRTTKSWDT